MRGVNPSRLAAIAFLFTCAVHASLASTALGVSPEADCARQGYRTVAPGVYIQDFDKTDVTGGIAGLPDRITTDLAPGQSGHVCVGFHNRTGQDVTMRFATHDVGAGRDGAPVPFASGDEVYGAGTWLTLPTTDSVTAEHGELVWLDVAVDVPQDTSGGSAYAGVSAVIDKDANNESKEGTQTRISPSVVVQVFFDVPGDITESGKLEDVRSPRLVWWDGFDLGDIPILERLRGSGIATARYRWKNTGSITDAVSATLTIESSLGGKDVARIQLPERVVLRDASRPFEVTWSKDIPFVGRFEPTLEVTRANGEVVTRELPAIWVIPSWWYLVVLAIALAFPLWWRRRSKRRYAALLERVEAAEARSDQGSGDDWDETSDEWH